ncbi:MAG: sigma-54-dependent Fis family transcriptional regulator [FCB group bacterium]|nr:sigma-54-dependent Fis family transcriptional regulator [FCB group bacterium]
MKPYLLIIDDDRNFISDLTVLLQNNYTISSATSPSQGLVIIETESPDIVLLDLMFDQGSINGLETLKRIRRIDENLPVIMITDYSSIDTAVEAMRLGATNYLSKTPNLNELNLIVEKALKERVQRLQSKTIQEETGRPFNHIVGESPAILRTIDLIGLLAGNENPVLITGESGTGKELVARQIHVRSARRDYPFIALNCAAIPRDLLESELFGHEKGAFTGAGKRKLGKFEIASDGTLFFDEIGELDLDAQVKLLRVLQEKEFERVGGNRTITSRARIIAATNGDLQVMVKSGRFREDLYYRLDVLRIHVPPLRERDGDIRLLARHFIQAACNDLKVPLKTLSQAALHDLKHYSWPGNVRELRNLMTRATIMTPEAVITAIPGLEPAGENREIAPVPMNREQLEIMRQEAADHARREVERRFVNYFLDKYNGNVSQAAREAGMNRTNFHKMMSRCKVNHRKRGDGE